MNSKDPTAASSDSSPPASAKKERVPWSAATRYKSSALPACFPDYGHLPEHQIPSNRVTASNQIATPALPSSTTLTGPMKNTSNTRGPDSRSNNNSYSVNRRAEDRTSEYNMPARSTGNNNRRTNNYNQEPNTSDHGLPRRPEWSENRWPSHYSLSSRTQNLRHHNYNKPSSACSPPALLKHAELYNPSPNPTSSQVTRYGDPGSNLYQSPTSQQAGYESSSANTSQYSSSQIRQATSQHPDHYTRPANEKPTSTSFQSAGLSNLTIQSQSFEQTLSQIDRAASSKRKATSPQPTIEGNPAVNSKRQAISSKSGEDNKQSIALTPQPPTAVPDAKLREGVNFA